MFPLKRYGFLHIKNLIGYKHDRCDYMKQVKQCLYVLNTCHLYTKNNERHLCTALRSNEDKYNRKDNSNIQSKVCYSHISIYKKRFCTEVQPKDSNKFGDLSYEKYERVPMDETEKQEEKISDYVKIPKWQKYSFSEYCQIIRSHIHNKNLQLALNVLDLMKENGVKPSIYMYKLLISAHALQGDIQQCFALFRNMKQNGLIPPPAIYTSLINACAETTDTSKALERLSYLREYFHNKNIQLNKYHYATFIKAYSRHKQILTAFEIADEMKDKGMCTAITFALLFHTAIADQVNGLKYALILWHKMRMNKIKPTIVHYNLLLRAIRDTQFGSLKVNDILIPGAMQTQIQINETARPDLLSSPPVLNTSVVSVLRYHKTDMPNTKDLCKIDDKYTLLSENLNHILCANRLILFGGIDKILKQMKDENVIPDLKTFTILLELLPPTVEAEKCFLQNLQENHFMPDAMFFNKLIKRRSLRGKYHDAKAVLNEFQIRHLMPNINTFEALAYGCRRQRDGIELLQQINTIGYAVDNIILEKLLYNACYTNNFGYVSYLMNYILRYQIVPSQKILEILKSFDELLLEFTTDEDKYRYSKMNEIRKNYNKFKIHYENWKEKIQKKQDVARKRYNKFFR
ncbi:Pentatricopeptide repeat-containing protein 1, mitochondrial [Anthophora quadrimaculata]